MNLLAIAALVLFIVGAVLAFLVDTVAGGVLHGILFAGLACWVASTVVPGVTR